MSESGFVGTYLEVEKAGKVHITLRAEGHADQGAAPRVGLVVADVAKQFDVTATPDDYELVTELPEGTYFVRAEFENGSEGSRELTFHEISVEGAQPNRQQQMVLRDARARGVLHFTLRRRESRRTPVHDGGRLRV